MTQITEFGRTAAGGLVQRIMMRSEDMQVAVLTLGATLQSVRLDGVPYDLTVAAQSVLSWQSDCAGGQPVDGRYGTSWRADRAV